MAGTDGKIYNTDSEYDEIRGIICPTRRTNHIVTGQNLLQFVNIHTINNLYIVVYIFTLALKQTDL